VATSSKLEARRTSNGLVVEGARYVHGTFQALRVYTAFRQRLLFEIPAK
jgi:hypothetical protein